MAKRQFTTRNVCCVCLVACSIMLSEQILAAAPPLSVDLQATSDSGVNNSDNLTNLTTPTIEIVAATAGDTINVYKGGQFLGEAVLVNGNLYQYVFTDGQLSEGINTITARSFDTIEESIDSPALNLTLDTLGPHIIASGPVTPINLRAGTLDNATVTFNEPVNATITSVASFDVGDVSIIGPNSNIPADQLTTVDGIEFTITFASQTLIGDYAITVQPDLVDLAGNFMDQDLDGIPGEMDQDAYQFQLRAIDVDHLITQATSIVAADTTYDNSDVYISGAAIVIEGDHLFNNLHLGEGASVAPASQAPLALTINSELIIDAGSTISATGRGFGSTSGPGAGAGSGNGTGAGYGGYGGNGGASSGLSYGSITAPIDMGSGGGYGWYTNQMNVGGGTGGGAIHLTVNGLLHNEGEITAHGANGGRGNVYTAYWSGGGGSGGSIWLDVNTITGNGVIAANGGNGGWTNLAGGGGGGRIALYYQTSNFVGELHAQGGAGVQFGGAGTVYLKSTADAWGYLHISNAGSPGATTPLPDGGITFDGVSSEDAAKLEVPASSVLNVIPTQLDVVNHGELLVYGQVRPVTPETFASVVVSDGGKITLADGGNISCQLLQVSSTASVVLEDGAALTCDQVEILSEGTLLLNTAANFSQMHIADGGLVTHRAGDADFHLTIDNDLVIDALGAINVSGRGNGAGAGPGATATSGNSGGAGYGGKGGNGSASGGAVYGEFAAPTELGSGAGTGWYTNQMYVYGGAGGGAVHLTVNGELVMNGSITANGTNGGAGNVYLAYWSGGGGSGGSIWLDVNTISGNGLITANGGNGGWTNRAGGGGGGRIALYYQSNNYGGELTALGGAGAQYGGAGSVYNKSSTQSNGQLILGNSDATGASTPLPDGDVYLDSITSTSGARLEIAPATTLHLTTTDITLDTGGELLVYGQLVNSSQISFNQISVSDGARLTVADGGQLACTSLSVSATGRIFLNDGNALQCQQAEILSEGIMLVNAEATFSQLHVYAGGLVTHTAGDADFSLHVSGDVTVDVDGAINVNGLGYGQASGPGAGASSGNGGGGGYGGRGGSGSGAGGAAYGDPAVPIDLGSGGGAGVYGSSRAGGGSGGGKVTINAGGTLTVDGVLSANGTNGGAASVYLAYWSGGGGSGGSVHLQSQTLAGSGVISATGGNGGWSNLAGGGGGGRMALYYGQYDFSGEILINGGAGAHRGEQGSVFTIPSEHQLQLNQDISDVLTNPFGSAVWHFSAQANQQLRLEQLIAATNIVFELSGPNDWIGFSELSGDSGLINLPVSGDYALTVRSTDSEVNKSYQFRLVGTPVYDISIDTPFNGTLSVADKAQLFRIAAGNDAIARITLDDMGGNGRELYVKFGSPPTPEAYDYRFNTTNGYQNTFEFPNVPSDMYVLIYSTDSGEPHDFTLLVETMIAQVTAATPDHASHASPITLTVHGSGFDTATTLALEDRDGNRYPPAAYDAVDANRIVANYLPNSLPANTYTVVVTVSSADIYSEETLEILGLAQTPAVNIDRAYQYIYDAMDKYHQTLDVYTDFIAGGNHFMPDGWVGNTGTLSMDDSWSDHCIQGASCIKISYTADPNTWAGIYWLSAANNWGSVANGGLDVAGATQLRFWAKGESGGEQLTFMVGGVDGAYGDSLPQVNLDVTLSPWWQQYSIDLSMLDLSHVVNGFAFTVNSVDNPAATHFYLDDIRYDKSRLDEPRFIESFTTDAVLETDRYVNNAAMVYDNAVALLALLARGNNNDNDRARLLADAFVIATQHDRAYTDGRLRNAYSSGELQNHVTGATRLSGWWDQQAQSWQEDPLLIGTHTGNMAWVINALLESYVRFPEQQAYLDTAIQLGEWIENNTRDERGSGGYTGGVEGEGTALVTLPWKSTEHNMDVYIAFSKLFSVTHDTVWEQRAAHAWQFVSSMWNTIDGVGHFFTGTLDDGVETNQFNYPVDIQALANLFSSDYALALPWAENMCLVTEADREGFDFNTDRDGIWYEGTAQMALAYHMRGNVAQAERYRAALRQAQYNATNTDGRGIVSATLDGLTTGFDWQYYRRLQIAATAWYALVELGNNPYTTATSVSPAPDTGQNPGGGGGGGGSGGGSSGGGGGWVTLWTLLVCLTLLLLRRRERSVNARR